MACGEVTEPHEKQHRIVCETRPKVYTGRYGEEWQGIEIVREATVCGECAGVEGEHADAS
jgi:hypothetical protein